MPVRVGDAQHLTVVELIAQARGSPDWTPPSGPAFLWIVVPATGAWEAEGPTSAAPPDGQLAAAAGTTLVVPLVRGKHSVDSKRLSLGRSSVCDLVIPLAAISKVHAYFAELAPGKWTIEDAGARNGVRMGDAALAPQRPTLLADGAKLKLGDVEVTFWTREGLTREVKGYIK